mgnify:CR=1 FL=1
MVKTRSETVKAPSVEDLGGASNQGDVSPEIPENKTEWQQRQEFTEQQLEKVSIIIPRISEAQNQLQVAHGNLCQIVQTNHETMSHRIDQLTTGIMNLEKKLDIMSKEKEARERQEYRTPRELDFSSNNSGKSLTGAFKKTTLNTNAVPFTPQFLNTNVDHRFKTAQKQQESNNRVPIVSNSTRRPNQGNQSEDEESIDLTIEKRSTRMSDKVRVDKWCLKFDGRTGLSVNEFIFRIETMQKHYNYPWSEIIRDFAIFVSGDASKCFWKVVKHNPEIRWPKLREALIHRFGSRKSDLTIWREMTERKQGQKEKFVDYFDAMIDLREQLTNDLPESEVIKLIKMNASRFIRNMVYPQTLSTIDDLFEACLEVESSFSQYEEAKRFH